MTSNNRNATRWARDTENRIYREQSRLIEQDYGKDAAEKANYGWGVIVNSTFIAISTKIYLAIGNAVLTSSAAMPYSPRKKTVIVHSFEGY